MSRFLVTENYLYLSGAITNDPDYVEKFTKAAAELRAAGHEVWNPVEFDTKIGITEADVDDDTYWQILRHDVKRVALSAGVVVLPDWGSSHGACIEVQVARLLHIPVFSWAPPFGPLKVVRRGR